MSTETQCNQIKAHLESGGTITSLEAVKKFGCIHLPRRILDIKESGYPVDATWIKTDSGKRVKRWFKGAA